MTRHPMDFLVTSSKNRSRSLPDAIRRVSNASAGFCAAWKMGNTHDAEATSEEAMHDLDHIQNELLRERDDRHKNNSLRDSPFAKALHQTVGEFVAPVDPVAQNKFTALLPGKGALPHGVQPKRLTLEVALNKLKHRTPKHVNFSLSPTGDHIMYVLTLAGAGHPDALCSIDVSALCTACRVAEQAL